MQNLKLRRELYDLRRYPHNKYGKKSPYVNNINRFLGKLVMLEEIEEFAQNKTDNDHCYIKSPTQLSEYVAEVGYYIAGFVVKKIKSN